MAHILHAQTEQRVVTPAEKDADGNITVPAVVDTFLKAVTFMRDAATPHTLTFLEKGLELVDGQGAKYMIGDAEHAYHEYKDAETAIQDYLDGKV